MSIIKPSSSSAPVFYPKTNYSIVKYMDLTKFISMLFRKSLFFCRLDKLEDPFEGTTAKSNYDLRKQWHEALRPFLHEPITDEEVFKQVQVMYDHEKQMKSLSCINCWNKCENESAALWKIYADFNKGIMLKSSINKLHDAFLRNDKEIQLSEVKYIDFQTKQCQTGTQIIP